MKIRVRVARRVYAYLEDHTEPSVYRPHDPEVTLWGRLATTSQRKDGARIVYLTRAEATHLLAWAVRMLISTHPRPQFEYLAARNSAQALVTRLRKALS